MQVEDCLRDGKSLNRLRTDYLRHARSAFQACEAVNLVRLADTLASSISGSREEGSLASDRRPSSATSFLSGSGMYSPSNPGDLLREIDTHSRSSNGKEPEQRGGRLGLEGILNSFLLLASEKNSEALIRRVLHVLLQVTCTHYACLATEDPSSGLLKLKGYGRAFEEIKVCNKSLADAKSFAPTALLTHASIVRKVSKRGTRTTSPVSNPGLMRIVDPTAIDRDEFPHGECKSPRSRAVLLRHRSPEVIACLAPFRSGSIFGAFVPIGQCSFFSASHGPDFSFGDIRRCSARRQSSVRDSGSCGGDTDPATATCAPFSINLYQRSLARASNTLVRDQWTLLRYGDL